MRFVSLFSGIEAASVAWEPLGWEAVAFAEIEPFPCAVLEYRFPDVPNLGDVTKIDWEEFRKQYGAVDLVCGGSPYQSFSIAGGREGLDGESRLMFEYIRACDEVRPPWVVWENVPGVFSIDGGRAFGILIDSLEKLGYGVAWGTLDAQFFGVAQRRRRVWLVGHLGDMRAAAVLFDADCLRGNTLTSREKRARLAADPEGNARADSDGAGSWSLNSQMMAETTAQGPIESYEIAPTLDTNGRHGVLTAHQNASGDVHIAENLSGTITSGSSVSRQQILCVGSDMANAPIDAFINDIVGPLCARDYKGVGNEYVDEGKLICTRLNCATRVPRT